MSNWIKSTIFFNFPLAKMCETDVKHLWFYVFRAFRAFLGVQPGETCKTWKSNVFTSQKKGIKMLLKGTHVGWYRISVWDTEGKKRNKLLYICIARPNLIWPEKFLVRDSSNIFLIEKGSKKTEPPPGSQESEVKSSSRTTAESNLQIKHCGLQKV